MNISIINFYFPNQDDTIDINLKAFRLLRDGITWYQVYGFTNEHLEHNKDQIIEFIKTPLVDFELMSPSFTYFDETYGIDELFELLLEDLNVTQMDLYHHEMSGIKKKSKKKKQNNNSTFRK